MNPTRLSHSAAASAVLVPAQGRVPLAHWGVIRAEGADAATFLQGQLTQDMSTLDAHHARWAGYCSAKGRLLATFLVWRPSPDVYLLACSADILAATLKRLQMFVLRAQCKLVDATLAVNLEGRWLADSADPSGGLPLTVDHGVIRLPSVDGHRRDVAFGQGVGPVEGSDEQLAAWHWLEVGSGVPWIVAATQDAFVPQMVNLELVGGVNFKKGCFPGQEVVARSQYRGTLKRRMHLFEGADAMNPGDEVFHASDPTQPVGTVVNAATIDARHQGLVSLKLSALDPTGNTCLTVGSIDGPRLLQLPPPYPVPHEAVD